MELKLISEFVENYNHKFNGFLKTAKLYFHIESLLEKKYGGNDYFGKGSCIFKTKEEAILHILSCFVLDEKIKNSSISEDKPF